MKGIRWFSSGSGAEKNFEIPSSIRNHLTKGKMMAIVGLREEDMNYAHTLIGRYYTEKMMVDAKQIAIILNNAQLYDKLTIVENIYIDRKGCLPRMMRSVTQECEALFLRYGIELDASRRVRSLNEDERKIVELLCVYIRKPVVLFMRDPLASLSYYYTGVYRRILEDIKEDGCILIYLSTKWENILPVGDYFGIVSRETLMESVFQADELKQNPRRLVYLLSGLENSSGKLPVSYNTSQETLQSLYRVNKLFIKNYELEDTLCFLTQEIASIMGVDRCALYLQDESREVFSFSSEEDNPHRLRDEFISTFLKDDRDVFHLPLCSYEAGNYFTSRNAYPCAMLCLAITSESERIGILTLIHGENFICTEEQLVALNTFSNEVAIFLETSKYINQSTLLRESHHRINNNLQIIIGLLYNQKHHFRQHGFSNDDSIQSIDSLVSRIKSISLVHDLLSQNNYGGNTVVMDKLIDELLVLWGEHDVLVRKDIEPLHIAYNKATSLAMIVNELISNSFKHAYDDNQIKILSIQCRQEGDVVVLRIADNGHGLPEGFSMMSDNSVGMSIIGMLTKSLRGTIQAENNNGAVFCLRFPLSKATSSFAF